MSAWKLKDMPTRDLLLHVDRSQSETAEVANRLEAFIGRLEVITNEVEATPATPEVNQQTIVKSILDSEEYMRLGHVNDCIIKARQSIVEENADEADNQLNAAYLIINSLMLGYRS